jgi:hypothetical protein
MSWLGRQPVFSCVSTRHVFTIKVQAQLLCSIVQYIAQYYYGCSLKKCALFFLLAVNQTTFSKAKYFSIEPYIWNFFWICLLFDHFQNRTYWDSIGYPKKTCVSQNCVNWLDEEPVHLQRFRFNWHRVFVTWGIISKQKLLRQFYFGMLQKKRVFEPILLMLNVKNVKCSTLPPSIGDGCWVILLYDES